MSEKKILSFQKIGYTKNIAKGSDLDNFEIISIKNKSGETITLYRNKLEKEEFDEISDFSKSWNIFNSHQD